MAQIVIKKARYRCNYCNKYFKDKAPGLVLARCPKCGTSATSDNMVPFLARTRKVGKAVGKWGTCPVWLPLWTVLILFGWRFGVKTVGAWFADYGLRVAKIRSLSRSEKSQIAEIVKEAIVEAGIKPRSQNEKEVKQALLSVRDKKHAQSFIGMVCEFDSPTRGRIAGKIEDWFPTGLDGNPAMPWVVCGEPAAPEQITIRI